jgi:hypothetical protein
MKAPVRLLLGVLVVLLAGCGGLSPSLAIGDTPTPTITPLPTDTPTPTPPPLTTQEQDYFLAISRLRERYDHGLMSWSLMEDSLKALKAPAALADTHDQLVSTITEANFATTMFRLSAMTYVLSYCSFSSLDYFSCKLRQDNARSDMQKYATQADAARAHFRTLWNAAHKTWDHFRAQHAVEPMPTVTPFPLPPIMTPAPLAKAVAGVLGVEVVVTAVNADAWSVIKAAKDSNVAPPTGRKYMMVTVKVVNRGSERVLVDRNQFSLYANGESYAESEQTNPNDFVAKELMPGESTGGNVSFTVPTTASVAVLLYLAGDVVMALE